MNGCAGLAGAPAPVDALEVLAARADSCANRRDEALERRDAAMAAYWRAEYAAARDAHAAIRELLVAVQTYRATPAADDLCGIQGCGRTDPAACRCQRNEQATQALDRALDRLVLPATLRATGEG